MAASKRITYATQSPTGGVHLALAVRYTILAKQEIARAVNLMNEITNGGVDGANLETPATEFTAASGQGGALYTAANNLKTNLATITDLNLADLDPGN